ncbi:MAG TPA: hypothetical protein VNN10_08760 [Dehalococcoidia bacterium]|nr:hypothetical protein [Dehalococcoidia bacterium]
MDPPKKERLLTLGGVLTMAVGLALAAQSWAAPANGTPLARSADKVVVCHREGNGSSHEIEVDDNALPAHMDHGDALGPCPTATGIPQTAVTGTSTVTSTPTTAAATNTPTATATSSAATNTPTATTAGATNTPTATATTGAATNTPTATATTGAATNTPTPTETVVNGALGIEAGAGPGAAGGVQGGADLAVAPVEQPGEGVQGAAGLQEQVLGASREGVLGAARATGLPSAGDGGEPGGVDCLLVAGVALVLMGGALAASRFTARG